MTKCRNRKGSSSILVILLIVTMVVFGVLAMMSSYSGLKMARKTAQWTNDYYELESKAEVMLYDIKNIVNESIKTSGEENQGYWSNLNRNIEQLDSPEISLTYNSNEITVKGDFINSSGDKFLALIKLKNISTFREEDLIKISSWKFIPRDVEYDDAIQFENLEVEIEND